MKNAYILPLLFAISVAGNAQTIKRWPNGKGEINSKQLSYNTKPNIFDEFNWTYPDVKSIPVHFENGKANFQFAGKSITAELTEKNKMSISSEGINQEREELMSDGKMYYDKSALKLKAVTQQMWTSHTVMTQQMVPVQRTRMVTSYSYQNGRSVPVYRSESYTAYESRPVSRTEWRYVPHTTYVLDIPKYPYYDFELSNTVTMVVYKTANDRYYAQNSAFIIATDENSINHIFIDANSNGDFFDNDDKVIFNSWNPFSASSAYRSAGAYRDNKWYEVGELKKNQFLTFSTEPSSGTLSIEYENSKYTSEDDKGSVQFTAVPEDARLYVNGKEYKVKSGDKKFKSQYGKFLVRICKKGYLDFERVYTVDEQNKSMTIAYAATEKAGTVKLENIYEPNYSITVSNPNGYSRTYTNEAEINVPVGKNTIAIYSNGFTLNYEAEVEHNGTTVINFESEVNKLKKEEEKE